MSAVKKNKKTSAPFNRTRTLLKGRAGMTLLECIIACAITAVLAGSMTVMLTPIFKGYTGAVSSEQAKSICYAVMRKLEYTVRYAESDPVTSDGCLAAGESEIDVNALFEEAFYDGYTLDLVAESKGKLVKLTLEAQRNGRTVYTMTSEIELLNYELFETAQTTVNNVR